MDASKVYDQISLNKDQTKIKTQFKPLIVEEEYQSVKPQIVFSQILQTKSAEAYPKNILRGLILSILNIFEFYQFYPI